MDSDRGGPGAGLETGDSDITPAAPPPGPSPAAQEHGREGGGTRCAEVRPASRRPPGGLTLPAHLSRRAKRRRRLRRGRNSAPRGGCRSRRAPFDPFPPSLPPSLSRCSSLRLLAPARLSPADSHHTTSRPRTGSEPFRRLRPPSNRCRPSERRPRATGSHGSDSPNAPSHPRSFRMQPPPSQPPLVPARAAPVHPPLAPRRPAATPGYPPNRCRHPEGAAPARGCTARKVGAGQPAAAGIRVPTGGGPDQPSRQVTRTSFPPPREAREAAAVKFRGAMPFDVFSTRNRRAAQGLASSLGPWRPLCRAGTQGRVLSREAGAVTAEPCGCPTAQQCQHRAGFSARVGMPASPAAWHTHSAGLTRMGPAQARPTRIE